MAFPPAGGQDDLDKQLRPRYGPAAVHNLLAKQDYYNLNFGELKAWQASSAKDDIGYTEFEADIYNPLKYNGATKLYKSNSVEELRGEHAMALTATSTLAYPQLGIPANLVRNLASYAMQPLKGLHKSSSTASFIHFHNLEPLKGLHKSSSAASLIHFHNLEPLSISELYSHSYVGDIPNGLNRTADKEMLRLNTTAFNRAYKSYSCPQTPRRRQQLNTAPRPPAVIVCDHGLDTPSQLRDAVAKTLEENELNNNTESGTTRIINTLEEPLPEWEDADRQRRSSVSFVTLFSRCRFERDTETVPSSPAENDAHVLDHEMLLNRIHDLLCAERVSQMTKTYNDIEAVTRLLEEKERDLELAARIGQTLLSKNKEVSARSEALEEQLSLATDKVNQLRHDLSMKDELLRFYNEDLEQDNSGDSTPNDKLGAGSVDTGFLEKKVKTLEDENLNLRLESAQLKTATDSYEEKEKKLVEDCIEQLAEVNHQVESLAEELHHRVEENSHQKEEITGLLFQIAELQTKIRKLTLENLDLHEKFTASTESQRKLTKELGNMQDKYDELFEMLEEAQDELRLMRSKHRVRANGNHHHSAYSVPTDSLASELETSLQQELSESNRRSHSWKVFETARAAKRAAAKAAQRGVTSGPRMSIGASPSLQQEAESQAPSACQSDVESLASDGYSADMDSLYGSNPELGQPGIPGSNDLESALKRLAMRRANELNERDYHEEEEERRRKKQATVSGTTSPYIVKSPDPHYTRSPSGSVSSAWSSSGIPPVSHSFKLSEKLQIVKPLEGSMTLRHWQHLATPHLGGIFEERDGVQIKGEKKLDLVEEVYSLSDFEEDAEETTGVHTRREEDLSLIYTFTDSTVRNPGPYRNQGDLFGTSLPTSNTTFGESFTSDNVPIRASTPKPDVHPFSTAQQSVKPPAANTQSTYSMSLGLAALLQGRENTGIGRALLKASSAHKTNTTKESEPTAVAAVAAATASASTIDLNQRVLSSRSFGNYPLTASASKDLPGSRSFDQAMKEYEEKALLERVDPTKKPEHFTPGMTGQGFLQQLKSKGLSLYGLWGGPGKESSADLSEHVEESSPPTTKATTESVFSNGASAGVLGAITNFRRNGMF